MNREPGVTEFGYFVATDDDGGLWPWWSGRLFPGWLGYFNWFTTREDAEDAYEALLAPWYSFGDDDDLEEGDDEIAKDEVEEDEPNVPWQGSFRDLILGNDPFAEDIRVAFWTDFDPELEPFDYDMEDWRKGDPIIRGIAAHQGHRLRTVAEGALWGC